MVTSHSRLVEKGESRLRNYRFGMLKGKEGKSLSVSVCVCVWRGWGVYKVYRREGG